MEQFYEETWATVTFFFKWVNLLIYLFVFNVYFKFFFFFFKTGLHSMWTLNSLTRGRICTLSFGSAES